MNLDDTGIGAGVGGFLTAIAMALGFKSRMDRQDRDIDSLKNKIVYKDTFEEFMVLNYVV